MKKTRDEIEILGIGRFHGKYPYLVDVVIDCGDPVMGAVTERIALDADTICGDAGDEQRISDYIYTLRDAGRFDWIIEGD